MAAKSDDGTIVITATDRAADTASARPRLAEHDGWEGFEDDRFAFPAAPPQKPMARRMVELGGFAVLLLVVTLGLKSFVVDTFNVPSESMSPTVEIGDRFLVNRLAFRFDAPQAGDVVVFDRPADAPVADDRLVKRIVATSGETVAIVDGRLIVDGDVVEETYLAAGTVTGDMAAVEIPADHVFVLGDNRPHSIDSRVFGPVPESLLVGRAVVRIWPLDRVGGLG